MRKRILYLTIFFIFIIFLFLNLKSTRYTGYDFSVKKEEISNFKKIKEFYIRYYNYKKLVDKIIYNSETKEEKIIKISKWVYLNINKIKNDEVVVDSHPWTIVERKLGTGDQFSDILSVLLVINKTDSFFISNINNEANLTFFKHKQKWSIIDAYYGVYFLNNNKEFCSLDEHKKNKCNLVHLKFKVITDDKINKIFFDKNFKSLRDIQEYYNLMLKEIPSGQDIEKTNIYLRGGRSYVQKPLHRLIYQIQKYLKII